MPLDSVGHALQRCHLEPARPPLGISALGDQSALRGTLRCLEVACRLTGKGRASSLTVASPARRADGGALLRLLPETGRRRPNHQRTEAFDVLYHTAGKQLASRSRS
jgi:hypothetical protein